MLALDFQAKTTKNEAAKGTHVNGYAFVKVS